MLNTLLRLLRQLVFITLIVLAAGCATIDLDYPRTESTAYTDTGGTRLGLAVSAHAGPHSGDSGFLPLADGIVALAAFCIYSARRTDGNQSFEDRIFV